jgi:hypothetical protein
MYCEWTYRHKAAILTRDIEEVEMYLYDTVRVCDEVHPAHCSFIVRRLVEVLTIF